MKVSKVTEVSNFLMKCCSLGATMNKALSLVTICLHSLGGVREKILRLLQLLGKFMQEKTFLQLWWYQSI